MGYQGTQCVVEGQDLDNRTTPLIAGTATRGTTDGRLEAALPGVTGKLEGRNLLPCRLCRPGTVRTEAAQQTLGEDAADRGGQQVGIDPMWLNRPNTSKTWFACTLDSTR